MAELMMPTHAPTIAPTSRARVESTNPEPLVIWNETQFAELSSEELMLEVASLQSAEQKSQTDAASVNTPRTYAPAWAPTGSPTSCMSMIVPPLPPREIVFRKTHERKTSINNSTAPHGAVAPHSPRSPNPRIAKMSSQSSLLSSPSTNKIDSMDSLSPWELQAVCLPSIDVAVPLTQDISMSRLPPRTLPAAEEEPKTVISMLIRGHLSTLQANEQRSPFARFVEARLTTFLNNVEFLTGIAVSGKIQPLKGEGDKEDNDVGQIF
jgi:hypothetical protein